MPSGRPDYTGILYSWEKFFFVLLRHHRVYKVYYLNDFCSCQEKIAGFTFVFESTNLGIISSSTQGKFTIDQVKFSVTCVLLLE